MIIIQILLRIIYYPIGWLGDLFDFIAGSLQDIDEKIKMKRITRKTTSNFGDIKSYSITKDKIIFNGDTLPGHRNPPPPPRKKK